MFDIGFSEILLIFGLALIVLGPEKLPRVASQVGRWIGRARGMARQFREQLEEEVNLEEARKSRPPAVAAPPPPSPAGTSPAVTTPAAINSPAAPIAPIGHDASPAAESLQAPHSATEADLAASAQPEQPATTVDTAASVASEAAQPSAQPEPPPQYPDWYSHAHPTDSEGRPLPSPAGTSPAGAPTNDPAATESGQHDWVGRSAGDGVPAGDAVPAGDGGVTSTDKPAQGTPDAGYAPSHERGI